MRTFAALVFIVALAACASTLRQTPDAQGLTDAEIAAYRTAAAALDAGDPAKALATIETVTSRTPWHVPSHVLRQDALALLGREAEATAWYGAEAGAHPDDAARGLLAARVSPRDAGMREASYRIAMKRDDRSPWARIALAYELERKARDESTLAVSLTDDGFSDAAADALAAADAAQSEAERLAGEAARRWPDLAAAQAALADALLARPAARQGERGIEALRDALKAAEESARLDPGASGSWALLGRARRAVSDDAGAAKAFARAVEIAPKSASLRAALGRTLLDLQRDAEARDALAAAASLDPADAVTADNLGVALFRLGEFASAAAEFERATRVAPKDPRPYEGLALTRAEMGDRAGAAVAMESYLAAGGVDRDAARRFIDEMKSTAKP